MLGLAAFAIQNASVPAIAPADFQAGVFKGYYGQDVKADMESCFGEDQHMADSIDDFITAIKAKDWTTVESTIKEFTPEVKPHVDNCDDTSPIINSMYHNQEATVEAAKNDPDWQLKILKVVMKNKATITAGVADAESKWDSGDYFGAGEALGKIERMAADPWFIPL